MARRSVGPSRSPEEAASRAAAAQAAAREAADTLIAWFAASDWDTLRAHHELLEMRQVFTERGIRRRRDR